MNLRRCRQIDKFHPKRIIGAKVSIHGQLDTLPSGMEGNLKSRPFHAHKDDSQDMRNLMPGHFLVVEPIVVSPLLHVEEHDDKNGMELFDERQGLFEHIWKR